MRHELRRKRVNDFLTQKEVAEALKTTQTFYGKIENGKAVGTIQFWLRLQDFFKLSDSELWALAKEGVKIESTN